MSERVGSAKVKELADRLGVEVIASSRTLDGTLYSILQLWAPEGKVFKSNGLHYHHVAQTVAVTGPGPDWSNELAVVSDLVDA